MDLGKVVKYVHCSCKRVVPHFFSRILFASLCHAAYSLVSVFRPSSRIMVPMLCNFLDFVIARPLLTRFVCSQARAAQATYALYPCKLPQLVPLMFSATGL